MRQLWALVHAASACEKSLFSVATRGRSAEGIEIAIIFIYVSKVCQSCHQYVLELGKLCVRKCGIASPVNLLVGIIWRGGISHTIIVQKGIHCFLQLYTQPILMRFLLTHERIIICCIRAHLMCTLRHRPSA